LPQQLDVKALAVAGNIKIKWGALAPGRTANEVSIPTYYSIREANMDIAKAAATNLCLGCDDVKIDTQDDREEALASVLFMPKDDFEKWKDKTDSDRQLANLFDVPVEFVDIRKRMLTKGY
jgi:hypothetical protein